MADYEVFTKEPYAEYDISFDFERSLRPGATISAFASGYPKATKTTSGDMTATVLGTSVFSSTVITTRVKAGADGDRIKIEYRIIDSNGEKHEGGLVMEVVEK